jgi:hypothetical protein
MVEAMVALSVTGLASSVLLLSLTSATVSTDEAMNRFVAAGIMQTYMDEISGMRYMEYGASPFETSLVPGADETQATGRSIYDDIDDYNNIAESPPRDRNGQTLGNENGNTSARDPVFRVPATFMSRWRTNIDVFYVAENAWQTALSDSAGTNYRTVQVRVTYIPAQGSSTELSSQTRTFAYVPEP